MNITEISEILGVSRTTVSRIVNERGTVTPEMALRLTRAFDTTQTPSWNSVASVS